MQSENLKDTSRIIRKPELIRMLGVSDPSIYRWERAGKFPKRIRLGGSACGWLASEVELWLAMKASERDGAAPQKALTR